MFQCLKTKLSKPIGIAYLVCTYRNSLKNKNQIGTQLTHTNVRRCMKLQEVQQTRVFILYNY